MRMKDVATIKTNMRAADFWIVRRGSLNAVGSVRRDFDKEFIGVRVFRADIMVPDYLFYAMYNVHSTGAYRAIARGTLALVHITV